MIWTDSELECLWRSLVQRTSNAAWPSFQTFGAQGVRVCNEWQYFDDFAAWALDMGWQPGWGIRLLSGQCYSPDSCELYKYPDSHKFCTWYSCRTVPKRELPRGVTWVVRHKAFRASFTVPGRPSFRLLDCGAVEDADATYRAAVYEMEHPQENPPESS